MKTLAQVAALLTAVAHPTLPAIDLGDRVPASATNTGRRIVVSPAQMQAEWSWEYDGVDYTLGVDTDNFIQFIATSSPEVSTEEGVHVGMPWAQLNQLPGVKLAQWPGWGNVAVLPSGWMAMSSLGLKLPGNEIPPSTEVDAIFKGTAAGYGTRKSPAPSEERPK